jgi:predicted porin
MRRRVESNEQFALDLGVTAFWGDGDIKQYGLGVSYQLNPAVALGIAYNKFDLGDFDIEDESTIRFRTQVTF